MPPVIKRDKCVGCGECLFQCGMYVFEFVPDANCARVGRAADCVECFICESICPGNAITVYFKGLKKGLETEKESAV